MPDRSRRHHVLLLAAHGSSTDTLVIERVHAHSVRVSQLVPHNETRIGFARGAPSLRDVVSDLAQRDATLTVVPFMTSAGHYAKRVMPALLRESLGTADVPMCITEPIGASRRITGIMHRRALRLAANQQWTPSSTAIVIVGHGTQRHSASRDTAFQHARRLQVRGWGSVHAAFIDDVPDIATVVQSLHTMHVIVLPFLVGGASHAAIDVPAALGIPVNGADVSRFAVVGGSSMLLDEPLGVDAALSDIAADLAVRAWPRVVRSGRTHVNGINQRYDDQRLAGVGLAASQPAGLRRAHAKNANGLLTGSVHLVGAGPGAVDLLTVRAQRLLRKADVVVFDRLITADVLALARPDAQLVDVGKFPHTPQESQSAINDALVRFARDGYKVVRLKGGDPFVFGRGNEEVEACREAAVSVTVVPGLSSALVAPLVAGIALTERGVSRGFAVVTAATRTEEGGVASNAVMHVRNYAHVDTLVVLMGRARLARVCSELVEEGRPADTPVACVERATLPGQRTLYGTLESIADLADAARLESPMVTVIGPTARPSETSR